MRLDVPLLRLPLCFDATTLAAEVTALPTDAWVPHPDKLPGNAAVRLITPRGEMVDDVAGPMGPTRHLLACPYITQAMTAIGAVWGRGRLMRLAPGAVVPPHIDTNFYWRKHVRIHVPIITTPQVLFTCAGQTVHMAAGECWIFDTFSLHQVRNTGTQSRVHLVMDTVGSERLFGLIETARAAGGTGDAAIQQFVPPGIADPRDLMFERENPISVMSPWELRYHIAFIGEQARPAPLVPVVLRRLDRFAAGWAGVWAQYGPSSDGELPYQDLIAGLEADLAQIDAQGLLLRNSLPIYRQIDELLSNVGVARPAPAAMMGAVATGSAIHRRAAS